MLQSCACILSWFRFKGAALFTWALLRVAGAIGRGSSSQPRACVSREHLALFVCVVVGLVVSHTAALHMFSCNNN